jgi:hypothetical protein
MEQGAVGANCHSRLSRSGFPIPVGTDEGQTGKQSLGAIAVTGAIIWVSN